ncbi:GNAT family N-acetyltransferase [bacterium SCSIO 12741]|nr:GNAT family N-acetyltransferase [bacterium SCSIO 12741]
MQSIEIRKGKEEDVSALLGLITELAIYEKAGDQVEVTEEDLRRDGFGDHPIFEFFVALEGDRIAGIALYYTKYSTWKGPCLFLEDIVVREEDRRKGIGSRLFNAVIQVAKSRHVKRMEWQVLDWNEPAIQFYKKYQADINDEWLNGRLVYDQLQQF